MKDATHSATDNYTRYSDNHAELTSRMCQLGLFPTVQNSGVTGMNITTRIAARIPLIAALPLPSSAAALLNHRRSFCSAISLHRVHQLGLVKTVQSSRLEREVAKKMDWSLESCDSGVQPELGVVRLATEPHAEGAVEALRAGKVIAVPTDTLYGFACDACSVEAVNRIYEIKGRKHTNPLAICVGDVWDIKRFAVTDHLPHGLLEALLPGPVTLVLSRGESSILEKSLNPGLDSVGVRVPDYNFIRDIARGLGSALALTSANLSGQPSSVSIKDFENLWEHCAYVYNGGVLPSGRAGSTVVDLTRLGKYRILQPGSAREETVAILERHSLAEEGTAT